MRAVEDVTGGSRNRAACCADLRWRTGVDQQRLREGAGSLVLGATLRGWIALHGLVCGRKVGRRHRGVYMGFINTILAGRRTMRCRSGPRPLFNRVTGLLGCALAMGVVACASMRQVTITPLATCAPDQVAGLTVHVVDETGGYLPGVTIALIAPTGRVMERITSEAHGV